MEYTSIMLTCSWKYRILRAISSHRFTCDSTVIWSSAHRPKIADTIWRFDKSFLAYFEVLSAHLVGVRALEGALVSIQILELQKAYFTQSTDGVVGRLCWDHQLHNKEEFDASAHLAAVCWYKHDWSVPRHRQLQHRCKGSCSTNMCAYACSSAAVHSTRLCPFQTNQHTCTSCISSLRHSSMLSNPKLSKSPMLPSLPAVQAQT